MKTQYARIMSFQGLMSAQLSSLNNVCGERLRMHIEIICFVFSDCLEGTTLAESLYRLQQTTYTNNYFLRYQGN